MDIYEVFWLYTDIPIDIDFISKNSNEKSVIYLIGYGDKFYIENENLMLLGFEFKEELIIDGVATISIRMKKAVIKKIISNYEIVKNNDFKSIYSDISRLVAAIKSKMESEAMLKYIENGVVERTVNSKRKHETAFAIDLKNTVRAVQLLDGIMNGIREKSIMTNIDFYSRCLALSGHTINSKIYTNG